MDQNKLEKLRQIGYDIEACCAFCKHSKLEKGKDFGVCKNFTYDHIKHTGPDRYLSINRYGICHEFEDDEKKSGPILQSFKQFY